MTALPATETSPAPEVPQAAPVVATWQVAVALPIPALDFAPPHGWTGDVPVGCRVLLPWRGELTVGLVIGEGDPRLSHRLRDAVHVLDDPAEPWVTPGTVAGVCAWARDAHVPAGLVWGDLLGVGWEAAYRHRVRAVPGADLGFFGHTVPGAGWTDALVYPPALLDAIREQGLLDEAFAPQPRTVTVVRAREHRAVPVAARTVGWVLSAEEVAEVDRLTAKD